MVRRVSMCQCMRNLVLGKNGERQFDRHQHQKTAQWDSHKNSRPRNVTSYRLCKQSTGNNSALDRLSLRLVAIAHAQCCFFYTQHPTGTRWRLGDTSRQGRPQSLLGLTPQAAPRAIPLPPLEDLGFCCFGTWRHVASAGRHQRPPRKLRDLSRWTTMATRMRRPCMHR